MFRKLSRHFSRRRRSPEFKVRRTSSTRSLFSRSAQRIARQASHISAQSSRLIRTPRRSAGKFFAALATPLTGLYRWFLATRHYRQRRYLLWGLPSLLFAAVTLALAIIIPLRAQNVIDSYRDEGNRAFRHQQYAQAQLCYERLTDLESEELTHHYNLAIALGYLGETQRAESIMHELAPLENRGFDLAHLWRAKQILDEPGNRRSRDQLQIARRHLELARPGMDRNAELHYRLAQCYSALGIMDSAVQSLERAAANDPAYYFELFRLNRVLNRLTEAKAAIVKADDFYSGRVRTTPGDAAARIRWADLRVSLEDYDGAILILKQGLAEDPQGTFGQALSAVYITQYRKRVTDPDSDPATMLELLRLAIQYDPNSLIALQELAKFGIGTHDTEVQKLLEDLLAKGHAPAFVHFVLAARAWQKNETEASLFHIERAYQLDAELVSVANNLAYLLCFQEPPELERALALIESVLRKQPDDPEFRDTRGQILTKLGRYHEALNDLEVALPKLGNNRQIHVALAECYRALDQTALADRHAAMAEGMEKQSLDQPPTAPQQ